MKPRFTKNIYGITVFLLSLLNTNLLHAQLNCTTSKSIISGSFEIQTPSANLTLSITSQNGGVGAGNQSALLIRKSSVFCPSLLGPNTTDFSFINSSVDYVFQNTLPSNLFKAQAGVPFSITLNAFSSNASYSLRNSQIDFQNNPARRSSFTGSETFNGQTNRNFSILPNDFNIPSANVYTIPNIVFSKGTTRGYVILNLEFTSPAGGIGIPSEHFSIILPFVVEGILDDKVPILGSTVEPGIPQMILHNPPGDGSFTTFTTNKGACRSFSESASTDVSHSGNIDVTLGIAGEVGFIVTSKFEVSVTVSASAGGGSMEVKDGSHQKCVTVTNAMSTVPSSAGANNASIYAGYSTNLDIGIYHYLKVINGISTIDSGLIYHPTHHTAFYMTKADILADITAKNALIANPAITPKDKNNFLNQIKVWQQVLEKDSINIVNPNNIVLDEFDLNGGSVALTNSKTFSYDNTTSYDVTHFIEAGVGASFIVNFGGSGVSGGYEFKTKKSWGQTIAMASDTSNTIAYNLFDDEAGDLFKIKIVKDPTYGTPIFLTKAGTKSSCPYEGGYKRDQPRFEIVGLPTSKKDTTLSDVSLGTSGTFLVKACNSNTAEPRNYDFGFSGESVLTDLKITSAGSEGNQLPNLPITKFLKISDIPAGGCKVASFDINMSRRNAASAMSYSNIEFLLFSECDPAMKTSIFANVNFAGPLPPTGVAANKTEICNGTPITLTATCPVTTTPTWYTVALGGFPVAIGASVTVNPSVNTTYYVGCETVDYKRDRVATKLVLVGTPSTVLNLTSNFTTNSLQIANTTITASNKIFSPASVTYKAGNSLTFSPGFEAKTGSNFMARIGGCGN